MENTYKIMQSDAGYYVAERVPMNNLPGCCAFFWQQVSKTYARKGWAGKALASKAKPA